MILNSPYISGSLTVTGNIITSGSITISGSIASSSYAVSASEASKLQGLGSSSFAPQGTFNTVSQSYALSSGSLSTRITNVESTSSVLTLASGSFATMSGSLSIRVTNLESTSSTVSQSYASESGSMSSRVTLIEGQYATTGSNTFTNVQYISSTVNAQGFATSASLYTDGGLRVAKDSFISGTAYFNNVIVYGTASIQYVTASQINVGANIIYLNTQTPAVRYGGMAVADSGSNAGVTGSMLWDSVNNGWIYTRESGSNYSSGALISGPKSSVQGSEQSTIANYIMKGQGGDHITGSQIYDDGTTVQIPGNLQVTGSLINTGAATFISSVTATDLIISDTYANDPLIKLVTSTSGNVEVQMRTATTTYNAGIGVVTSGYDFSLFTNNTARLTIASTGAATFTAATQDAIQTVVRMSGNNASSQLKALDFKLTAGTPLWTISTAAVGTDAGINIMPNGSAGLSLTYAGAATFSSTIQATGVNIGTASPVGKLSSINTGIANTPSNSAIWLSSSATAASDGLGIGSSALLGYKWIQSYDGALALNPAGNNVLIGTTTDAGYKLDVSGTANFTGALNGTSASFSGAMNADSYGMAGAVQAMTWTTNTLRLGQGSYWQNIELWNGTTQVLKTLVNGNVGIGTSSPNHLLSLSATASNATVIGLYNTFNDATNRNWAIATNQTAFGDFDIRQSTAQNGNPITSGTSRLYIASTGAATFSSSVTINSNSTGLMLNRAAVGNYNGMALQTATVDKWFVGMRENLSSNNLIIYNFTTSHDALTISTTDAATFYSSVTAANYIVSNTSGAIFTASGGTGAIYGYINNTSGRFYFGSEGSSSSIIVGSSSYYGVIAAQGLQFSANTGDALHMTLMPSGNLGIGTSSPSSILTILKTITTNYGAKGNAAISLGTAGSANEANLINFGYDAESWQPAYMGYLCTSGASSSNGALVFATRDTTTNVQPTERMRITSGGIVGIGDTGNASFKLSVTGVGGGVIANCSGAGDSNFLSNSSAVGKHFMALSGASTVFYVASSGQIYSTSTSITSISDIAHKENIKTLETGLNEVMALKPSRFDWKEGRGNGKKNVAGFIAQDLELILPDLVEEYEKEVGSTESLKGIKMTDLIPTLVKAIQEQQTQIEALQSRIETLEK